MVPPGAVEAGGVALLEGGGVWVVLGAVDPIPVESVPLAAPLPAPAAPVDDGFELIPAPLVSELLPLVFVPMLPGWLLWVEPCMS